MSADNKLLLCRLCQKSNLWYIDIFDASGADGILLCEVIRELMQIEVHADDGLPPNACHECLKKLREFSDFKMMCIMSAKELRRKSVTIPELCQPERCRVKTEVDEFEEDDPTAKDGPTAVDGTCGLQGRDTMALVEENSISGNEASCRSPVPKEKSPIKRVIPKVDSMCTKSMSSLSGPVLKPVEVFVNIGAECGLASRSDMEERDPLSVDQDMDSSTLITISDVRVVRKESYSKLPLARRNKSILHRVKQGVGKSAMTETSLAESSAKLVSSNVCMLSQPGCEAMCRIQDAQEEYKSSCENSEGLVILSEVRVPPGSSDGPHPRTVPKQDSDRSKKSPLFKCKACEKVCISKYLLKLHQKVHVNEEPLLCKLCDKRFRTKENLMIHTRAHTGEKPHGCHQCTKSFSTRNILNKHIRTHTGEGPYECDSCNKKYATQEKLRAHSMMHTGERPFSCEKCGKGFHRKDMRNCHLKYCGTSILSNNG